MSASQSRKTSRTPPAGAHGKPAGKPKVDLEALLEKAAEKIPALGLFRMKDPGLDSYRPELAEQFEPLLRIMENYFEAEIIGPDGKRMDGKRPSGIPAGGALLVGNHGRMGTDAFIFPALATRLLKRPIRGMGDRALFRLPVFRDVLAAGGGVIGNRSNAIRLLKAGNLVIVYPGGGNEVMKPAHEAYQLLWKDRVGFVKVAAEAGVPIVPFAGVGVEELYENLPGWDAFEKSAFARRLEAAVGRRNRPMPPVRGLGPLPKPVKLIFRFGKPMPTDKLDTGDQDAVLEFQRAVKAEVESMIKIGRARWKRKQS